MLIANMTNTGMKKIVKLIIYIIFALSINVHAQSEVDDCIVYEKILQYFNKEYADVKYVYTGMIDPVTGDLGVREEREKGIYQRDFYIVDRKWDFDFLQVKYWFMELIKDSSVYFEDYMSTNDSIINCIFDDLKYQYKPREDIKLSIERIVEKRKDINIYYSSLRITFSKILYTIDGRALVYVGYFNGMGGGRDKFVYGFVFEKNNNDWNLKIVESW